MKLLFIDDEPIQHFIIQRMIVAYLSVVPIAQYYLDAKKALDFLIKHKANVDELPDKIFVDVNMSGMSGSMFLSKFNKHKVTFSKTIIVYIMSSSIDPSDIALAKKYDFVSAYLVKPVGKATFKEIFEKSL